MEVWFLQHALPLNLNDWRCSRVAAASASRRRTVVGLLDPPTPFDNRISVSEYYCRKLCALEGTSRKRLEQESCEPDAEPPQTASITTEFNYCLFGTLPPDCCRVVSLRILYRLFDLNLNMVV
jgi:hypothetical protein